MVALALGGASGQGRLGAQTVGEALSRAPAGVGERYVAPVVRALGHAFSSGTLPSVRASRAFRLTLSVGLLATEVPRGAERFVPVVPPTVAFGGRTHDRPFELVGATTPSAAGDGSGAVLRPRPGSTFEAAILAAGGDPGDLALRLPAGLELGRPWTPVLEATVGVGMATDLVVRFGPTVEWTDGLGDVSVLGGALAHSLDRYLDLRESRLGVRLTGSLQRLRAGGYLELLTSSAGLAVGTHLPGVELYAHGRVESADARLDYTVSNPGGNPALPPDGTRVRTRLEPAAKGRFGLGAVATPGPLRLTVELTPARYTSVTARLTWSRR